MQKDKEKRPPAKQRADASSYLIGLICGAYMLLLDKAISWFVSAMPCENQAQQSGAEFVLVAIAAAITFVMAPRALRKINKK